MNYFEYDTTSAKAEYYEILRNLMERWDHDNLFSDTPSLDEMKM